MKAGVTIDRSPRDGNMAFVRSPDNHSIELLQKGAAAAAEGAMDLDAQYRTLVAAARYRAPSTHTLSLSPPPARPERRRRRACLLEPANLFISRAVPAARFARPRALRLAV